MDEESRTIPITIRKEVRIRDRNKCKKCGLRKNLQFHHIIPFSELYHRKSMKSIIHKKENLILLCEGCHEEAPDNLLEFCKWLLLYPHLPPSFSKTIDLLKCSGAMLLLRKKELNEEGYILNLDKGKDFQIFIEDFETFLRSYWEVVLNYDEGEKGFESLSNLMGKYNNPLNKKRPPLNNPSKKANL